MRLGRKAPALSEPFAFSLGRAVGGLVLGIAGMGLTHCDPATNHSPGTKVSVGTGAQSSGASPGIALGGAPSSDGAYGCYPSKALAEGKLLWELDAIPLRDLAE